MIDVKDQFSVSPFLYEIVEDEINNKTITGLIKRCFVGDQRQRLRTLMISQRHSTT